MKCIDLLLEEHEYITIFLAVLEHKVKRLKLAGAEVDDELCWLFEFNRDYILRNHFPKEECRLFPALAGAGLSQEQVFLLVEDHEALGSMSKRIRWAIEESKCGHDAAAFELIDECEGYSRAARSHIELEESTVYPLAEELLDEETDCWLAREFEALEEQRPGSGRIADLQLALDLMGAYK